MPTIDFYTAAQSRAIDRYAIETQKQPGLLLMKRAAYFAYQTLKETQPDAEKIVVLCGGGNNGGDGWVLAQYALLEGRQVTAVLLGDETKIHGDALTALQELKALGLSPTTFQSDRLQGADIVVDAVFGTGLNQPVSGDFAEIFQRVNDAHKPVLAIDIPSGLHADTGHILGTAIRASHTCTFITQKPGLYTHMGPETAGKIHFSPLFLSQDSYQGQTPIAQNHSLKHWLGQRPPVTASSHKGRQGTVLLVGGNHHMMGAIQLAGLASLTSGAGLVKIVTQPEHLVALTQAQPELMTYPQNDLTDLLPQTNAIGLGPGLGQDDWAQALFQSILTSESSKSTPKVLDADALNLLAKQPQTQPNWVLTPHPGEAARLLGTDTADIQRDRFKAVVALQKRYGGVVVLKGNGTLVYDGKRMELCTAGNAGMAVGGMGDVLTGAITSFLAQGMDLFEAACLGVSLHAHSGDVLANQTSQAGVIPSDLALTMSQLLSYTQAQPNP